MVIGNSALNAQLPCSQPCESQQQGAQVDNRQVIFTPIFELVKYLHIQILLEG